MTEFTRDRSVGRYAFAGMKTNATPDSLAEYKYPIAINIRGYIDGSIQSRTGESLVFSAPSGAPILSICTYSAIETDNLPRTLAADSSGNIILDTGVNVGTIGALSNGIGISMIPFRPAQSPNPYMYVASPTVYKKYSAPSATDTVIEQKAGIAEPATACEATIGPAYPYGFYQALFLVSAWTSGGTAGTGTGGTRLTDTAGVILNDPVTGAQLSTVQVTSTVAYQRGMTIQIGAYEVIVTNVFTDITGPLAISSIYYFSGSTGHCVLTINGPQVGIDGNASGQNILGALQRGALIQIGNEIVYVWSVTGGPDNYVCVETSTTSTHTTSDTVTGVPAVQVRTQNPIADGDAITEPDVTFQVTAGIGTQTGPLSLNPFTGQNSDFGFGPQDYLSFGIMVDNLANLIEIKFMLDVGDGSFTENFYYYSIRPSDIAGAVANSSTQLSAAQYVLQREVIDAELAAINNDLLVTTSGAQTPPGSSQWAQIIIPLSQLTRVGNDQTKSLQNATKVQFLVNASGTVNVAFDNKSNLTGGYAPDVGDVGQGYRYRARPRSKVTGAVGNPSPDMRYGVDARRASVNVILPSAAYDSQIDTWDIFRFGGAVPSWQFIGEVPSTETSFIDIFSDSAAQAGQALDFDNFEPWPSIDLPFSVNAALLTGTTALVVVSPAGNTARFLPGNLVMLSDGNAYTLRSRPTSLGSDQWLFEFVESAGYGTGVPMQIYEPEIANQILPYLWGVDAGGTMFGVGDPLRPGTLYFSKNYAPDSAPDTYNIEICAPSEPLMGGEILDGLSYVASTERWWALYPQPNNVAQRYNVVQTPDQRGLASPFGHCTDGKERYWWAKDGIWSGRGSLTDADLYNLFPHDGIDGQDVVYAGHTIPAPDYTQCATFRLTYCDSYLYATYKNQDGGYSTLVCDLRSVSWSLDTYNPEMTTFFHPRQQSGALSNTSQEYPLLLIGSIDGRVSKQNLDTNDLGGVISSVLGSRELTGNDLRAPKQWGDMFLDCTPGSGITVTPVSEGVAVGASQIIAASNGRQRNPLGFGGILVEDFLGILCEWTTDYTAQAGPTQLNIWQISWVVQPAKAIQLYTFGTGFGTAGMKGYIHLKQIALAYVSSTPITLTVESYDGTSPANITFPSTAGAYRKTLFNFTFNKGLLYKFSFASSGDFQIFGDDTELWVGDWGRNNPYPAIRGLGARMDWSAEFPLIDAAMV